MTTNLIRQLGLAGVVCSLLAWMPGCVGEGTEPGSTVPIELPSTVPDPTPTATPPDITGTPGPSETPDVTNTPDGTPGETPTPEQPTATPDGGTTPPDTTTPPDITATPVPSQTPEVTTPPDDTPTPCPDADGDGYCSAADCDDDVPTTYPGATEVCDQQDNDCDDKVDEGVTGTSKWYLDTDHDGFGDEDDHNPVEACTVQAGRAPNSEDCNDGDPNINPNADEVCDGDDNNCDGITDTDASDRATWYGDADKDGYADPAVSQLACAQPDGYVAQAEPGDCNDDNSGIHPGATEACNGVDDNCDGLTDEGFDKDADGVKVCDGDCDDKDSAVKPGNIDTCDGRDNDCLGGVDSYPCLGYDDFEGGTTLSDIGFTLKNGPGATSTWLLEGGQLHGTSSKGSLAYGEVLDDSASYTTATSLSLTDDETNGVGLIFGYSAGSASTSDDSVVLVAWEHPMGDPGGYAGQKTWAAYNCRISDLFCNLLGRSTTLDPAEADVWYEVSVVITGTSAVIWLADDQLFTFTVPTDIVPLYGGYIYDAKTRANYRRMYAQAS